MGRSDGPWEVVELTAAVLGGHGLPPRPSVSPHIYFETKERRG